MMVNIIVSKVLAQFHSKSWNMTMKFIQNRRVPMVVASPTCHLEMAKSPITFLLLANLISGINANGSWTDYRMFNRMSIPVNYSELKINIIKEGPIDIERVKRTLCQTGRVKSRKPSITN